MKWHNLAARDIPEARFRLMRKILLQGSPRIVPRGADKGAKRLIISGIVKIKSPWTKPLLPAHPIVPSPVDNRMLDEFVSVFIAGGEWKARPGRPFYGQFIAGQMLYIAEAYKNKANWDSTDFCMLMGSSEKSLYEEDPWDLVAIDTLVEQEQLHFIAYFRDLDVFKLFPLFVPAIQILKAEIAAATELEEGMLSVCSKAFFLEEDSFDFARREAGLS